MLPGNILRISRKIGCLTHRTQAKPGACPRAFRKPRNQSNKENPFNNRNHVARCQKGGCFIEACNPIPRTAFALKSDCTVIASTESTLNRPASAPEPCFSPAHSKESGSISSLNRITSSRSTRFPRSFFPDLSQLVHLLFGKLLIQKPLRLPIIQISLQAFHQRIITAHYR